jgi:hypothetical protein
MGTRIPRGCRCLWRNAESRRNAEMPLDASRHAAGRADHASQHDLPSRPDTQPHQRSRVVASAFRAISAFHLPRIAAGARTAPSAALQTGFQDWQDCPSRPGTGEKLVRRRTRTTRRHEDKTTRWQGRKTTRDTASLPRSGARHGCLSARQPVVSSSSGTFSLARPRRRAPRGSPGGLALLRA